MSFFHHHHHPAATALLLLLVLVTSALSCPDECRCRGKDGVVYCNERDLTSAPESIPPDTKILFLQSNAIESSQEVQERLEPLTSLVRLVLDQNNLVSFPDRLPVSLTKLSINRNGMKFVGKNALSRLTNLKQLELEFNNITNAGFVSNVPLENVLSLRELLLAHNSLTAVPRGLPATIEVLNLNSNRITSLPEDIIRHMTSLEKLYLQDNLIQIVEGDLSALSQLSLLDLSKNQLREIPYMLPGNLSDLRMSSNRIRYIYKEKGVNTKGQVHGDLQNLKKLEQFDVSGNLLESVEFDSFKSLPINGRLSIGLENNPWRCDCNLKYLKRWLTSHTDAIVTSRESNIQCTTPTDFSQVAIGSMDLDAFRCTRTEHLFDVHDVTSHGFSITYDASQSMEAPYVKMWLMYGLAKCEDSCDDDSLERDDITATSWFSSYKMMEILSPRVNVVELAPRASHLVCVLSANQDPNRVCLDQCDLVRTLNNDVIPGGGMNPLPTEYEEGTGGETAPREKRVIPNWAIVTLSCVIAIAFVIAMFALVLWKVRNNKRHHHKRHHLRYHGGNGGATGGAGMIRMTGNVPPFIMQRTTPPSQMTSHSAPPNIVDADHEFDVALMTTRHKSPPPANGNHGNGGGGRKYPSDSCCYSDSHADSIETTATVTSLQHGGRDYVTSSEAMSYHPHHDVIGNGGYGGYHVNSSGVV